MNKLTTFTKHFKNIILAVTTLYCNEAKATLQQFYDENQSVSSTISEYSNALYKKRCRESLGSEETSKRIRLKETNLDKTLSSSLKNILQQQQDLSNLNIDQLIPVIQNQIINYNTCGTSFISSQDGHVQSTYDLFDNKTEKFLDFISILVDHPSLAKLPLIYNRNTYQVLYHLEQNLQECLSLINQFSDLLNLSTKYKNILNKISPTKSILPIYDIVINGSCEINLEDIFDSLPENLISIQISSPSKLFSAIAIQKLNKFQKLKTLSISNTNAEHTADWQYINISPELTSLRLINTNVDHHLFTFLKSIHALKYLYLRNININNFELSQLKIIQKFSASLEELTLSGRNVSILFNKILILFPHLKKLRIHNSNSLPITLTFFSKKLEFVYLENIILDKSRLEQLKNLNHLRELYYLDDKKSDEIISLKTLIPYLPENLVSILLAFGDLDMEDISQLNNLKHIKILRLHNVDVVQNENGTFLGQLPESIEHIILGHQKNYFPTKIHLSMVPKNLKIISINQRNPYLSMMESNLKELMLNKNNSKRVIIRTHHGALPQTRFKVTFISPA